MQLNDILDNGDDDDSGSADPDTSTVAARRRTRLSMDDEDSPPSTVGAGEGKGPGSATASASKSPKSKVQSKAFARAPVSAIKASERQSSPASTSMATGTGTGTGTAGASGSDSGSGASQTQPKEQSQEYHGDDTSFPPTEEDEDQDDPNHDPDFGRDESLMGATIRRHFENHGTYLGKVVSYNNPFYKIHYPADDDYEEMDPEEVLAYRVDEGVEAQFTQKEASASAGSAEKGGKAASSGSSSSSDGGSSRKSLRIASAEKAGRDGEEEKEEEKENVGAESESESEGTDLEQSPKTYYERKRERDALHKAQKAKEWEEEKARKEEMGKIRAARIASRKARLSSAGIEDKDDDDKSGDDKGDDDETSEDEGREGSAVSGLLRSQDRKSKSKSPQRGARGAGTGEKRKPRKSWVDESSEEDEPMSRVSISQDRSPDRSGRQSSASRGRGRGKGKGKSSRDAGSGTKRRRRSTSTAGGGNVDEEGFDLTLADRRLSLAQRSLTERNQISSDATRLVQLHHKRASSLSPVRTTSEETKKALRERSQLKKIGLEVGAKANFDRGPALDKKIREHLKTLKDGESPHPDIYRYMTTQEKAEFAKTHSKKMSTLVKQWQENAEKTKARAQGQSQEDAFDAIRRILLAESVDEINRTVDGLVAEGEDPKEASAKTNKATKAKVADRAAVLVDQGFTAVDGGIFYPEEGAQPASAAKARLSSSSSSSSSSSAVKSGRLSLGSSGLGGSSGKASRSMSVAANRHLDHSSRRASLVPSPIESTESVRSQAGLDDDYDFLDATAPQSELELQPAGSDGGAGGDENHDQQPTAPASSNRRRSSLLSGTKKRRLSQSQSQSQSQDRGRGRGLSGRETDSPPADGRQSGFAASAGSVEIEGASATSSAASKKGTERASEGKAAVAVVEKRRRAVEVAKRNMARKARRIEL